MQVIILAAGVGIRMGDLKVPKCLLAVNNKNVIKIFLETLQDLNLDDLSIRIVIGNQGNVWSTINQQRIQKICSDVVINPYNVDYDNAYSLWLGLEGIHSDELLLIDGDIFCEKEILKEFIDYPHRDVLLARPAANADEMGGKIYLSEGFVKVIGERLPIEYYPWKIYSGIARLSMETYQKLRTVLLNVHKIVDAFNIISCETKIRVMQPSLNNDISYYGWININTPDDYKTLLEKFEDI